MSQDFDAYYKWLGIPPAHQPPDHYRLLGIQPFEEDPDVIESAADGRLAHLRSYQSGQRQEICQQLLNEVASARVCLLNPQQRAAYDHQLRLNQAAPTIASASQRKELPMAAMSSPAVRPQPLPPVQREDVFAGNFASTEHATSPAAAVASRPTPYPARSSGKKQKTLYIVAVLIAVGMCILTGGVLLIAAVIFTLRGTTDPATDVTSISPPPAPVSHASPAPPSRAVDLIAISDPAVHGEKGRWRKEGSGLVVSNLINESFFSPPYKPPGEYDLLVAFSRMADRPKSGNDTHIRIERNGACYTFGIRTPETGGTALSFWGDGKFGEAPLGVTLQSRFEIGERHSLKFAVRDSGINVSLDGRSLFEVTDYSLLRKTDESIGLGSYRNSTRFHTYSVREVSEYEAAPVQPPRAVSTPDVISLFNGKDLTGWKYMTVAYSKSETNKTWRVDVHGNLVSTGGVDFNELGTTESYADFKLSLQWRFRFGGPVFPNGSGIIVRSSGMDNLRHNPRGIEIDLRPNQDVAKNIGTGCLLAYATRLRNHTGVANGEDQRRLGWLREPVLDQTGGWNDCTITCQGDKLTVEMNGVVVNRASGIEIPAGIIVLRNQKSAVEFRNIKLVKLQPN